MSLLTKSGITKLSELEIDANKDWGGYLITSISHVAAGMAKGCVVAHNGITLVSISPGGIGTELTTHGTGAIPSWEDPPG